MLVVNDDFGPASPTDEEEEFDEDDEEWPFWSTRTIKLSNGRMLTKVPTI